MYDFLPLIAQFALFFATVIWVGSKPTVPKVTVMICIVTVGLAAIDSIAAASEGLSIYGYYVQVFNDFVDAYTDLLNTDGLGAGLTASDLASVKEGLESFQAMVPTIAGLWVAIYFFKAAFDVLIVAVLAWVLNRLFFHKQWAPFSKVDLPISVIWVLIAGFVLYAVSCIPGLSQAFVVRLVAFNALLISLVPLAVQGAATGKGLMNRFGFGCALQIVISFALLIVGVLGFVVVVIGLIDFWANLRNLPRESAAH